MYFDMSLQHWTKLIAAGRKPCPRSNHATCCFAGPTTGQQRPLLMVVGGRSGNSEMLCDVWLLDVDKGQWSEVGMLYLSVCPATYKHADNHGKPVCNIRKHSANMEKYIVLLMCAI